MKKKAKFKIPMKGDAPPKIAGVEKCAGCGEPVTGDFWTILSGNFLIHYGGPRGLDCYKLVNGGNK
jgi:hypothetical protein